MDFLKCWPAATCIAVQECDARMLPKVKILTKKYKFY